jgi:hypothetical protein
MHMQELKGAAPIAARKESDAIKKIKPVLEMGMHGSLQRTLHPFPAIHGMTCSKDAAAASIMTVAVMEM